MLSMTELDGIKGALPETVFFYGRRKRKGTPRVFWELFFLGGEEREAHLEVFCFLKLVSY